MTLGKDGLSAKSWVGHLLEEKTAKSVVFEGRYVICWCLSWAGDVSKGL